MKRYTEHKTISGRLIRVMTNHNRRTFTIKTDSGKYRTNQLSAEEFDSCLYNNGNDWQQFLKSDDYYRL